jgi:hypothetical protein
MTAESVIASKADYERYLRLFMDSDPAWKDYYALNATMEFGGPGGPVLLHGVEAIGAAFADIHEIMSEKARVDAFILEGNSVIVTLTSDFVVKRDADYMGQRVTAGQTMQQQGELHYTLADGKIARVGMGGSFEQGDFA